MIMTNDAKQPQATGEETPCELRERSSYRTWLHARARLLRGRLWRATPGDGEVSRVRITLHY